MNTQAQIDRSSPEQTAARNVRIAEHAKSEQQRQAELSEARALQRKARLKTARELFIALNNVTASIDCTGGSDMESYKTRLTRLACEIEDDIAAFQ